MKDGLDIVQDGISLINLDSVKSQITGNIWPVKRPNNSDKIDIVVGLLNINNEWMQEGDLNFRIHAPNIERAIDGKTIQYPDQATFYNLTQLLLPLLDNQYRSTFFTKVSIPGELFRDRDGSHFTLIRVTYRSIQDNYKNI